MPTNGEPLPRFSSGIRLVRGPDRAEELHTVFGMVKLRDGSWDETLEDLGYSVIRNQQSDESAPENPTDPGDSSE
jgi:hypothetical protein